MKRILVLEPYYGGSHKYFLTGLQKTVPADYVFFTLPARNWKMRMQLSAVWFIEKIKALPFSERYFDTVLCSSFVDVAVFRALLAKVAGWHQRARILTYFHENQFAYPLRFDQPEQYQFCSINFHSALASDSIGFNTLFNRESFLDGCRKSLKAAGVMKFPGLIREMTGKSRILNPGVDFTEIDAHPWKTSTDIPVIVWNHRWEHDKNPQSFFHALHHLDSRGVNFHLIILGQSFATSPECFAHAKQQFKDKIIHYGFVPSRQQYLELLGQADIVVSTALHEFYGISIIEAVRAGCIPLLPDRLSYPELFPEKFLYRKDSLVDDLEEVLKKRGRLSRHTARALTDKFSWLNLQKKYAAWL